MLNHNNHRDAQQDRRCQLMLNEPIPRLLLKMSVPTIVAMLITSVYNMADTYFVHYLGTSATAAVGVNFTIDQIIMMAGSFIAVGSNSYIARLLGAGKNEKASQILSTAFFTAFIFGTVVAIVGLLFLDQIVIILGATPTIHPYATAYGRHLLYAAPFMATSFVMNQCLRSEGSATYSMVGMAAGGILNIILDPIFIFSLDMGVAGAAIATSISKIVSFTILLVPYIRRKSLLNLSIRNIKYSIPDCVEVTSVGLSSLFRSLLSVLAGITINKVAGSYSDSCLAAISVTTKIMMVPFSIFMGFGQGVQPVCGFNWGAKQYARVKEVFRVSSITSLLAPLVIAAGIGFWAEPIIGAFTNADAELIRIGKICVLTQCIALPLHAWGVTVNMICAGLGKARSAFLLSISRQGLFFFPAIWILPKLFYESGVASIQAVADILTIIPTLFVARIIEKELKEHLAARS